MDPKPIRPKPKNPKLWPGRLQVKFFTTQFSRVESGLGINPTPPDRWTALLAMIASLNIMAKTFAKTFVGLSVTIVAKGRILVLILHLEVKYAKMDCKNEIYVKNLVRSTWTVKSQLWQKVNGQRRQSTVNRGSQKSMVMTSALTEC